MLQISLSLSLLASRFPPLLFYFNLNELFHVCGVKDEQVYLRTASRENYCVLGTKETRQKRRANNFSEGTSKDAHLEEAVESITPCSWFVVSGEKRVYRNREPTAKTIRNTVSFQRRINNSN